MWLESVIYHKGRTERAQALLGEAARAWVALNIVIFVYRAYNSHAKGTVLFYKVEKRRKWIENE